MKHYDYLIRKFILYEYTWFTQCYLLRCRGTKFHPKTPFLNSIMRHCQVSNGSIADFDMLFK
jgi:hypothetical protein